MNVILIITMSVAISILLARFVYTIYKGHQAKKAPFTCFAQGLIKSVKETPEEWACTAYAPNYTSRWQNNERDNIELVYPGCVYEPHVADILTQNYPRLTWYEKEALGKAMLEHLVEPYKKYRQEAIEKERTENARMWEELGCPQGKGNRE